VDAQQQLKKTGMLVRSPNGYPMPSPYISISEKALDRMLKYQKEFGLTPSARSGIDVGAEEEPDDALDNLIKMKSQA
jgi:P27 family predicted phage terminase small subunit